MREWIIKSSIWGESKVGERYSSDYLGCYTTKFQMIINKIDYIGSKYNIKIKKDCVSYIYAIDSPVILYLDKYKQIKDVILVKDRFGNLYVNSTVNSTHKHLKRYLNPHINKAIAEKKNITWSYNLTDMVFYPMPLARPSSYERVKEAEIRLVTEYLESLSESVEELTF